MIPSGSPQAGRRAVPMASRLPGPPPAMGGMPVGYAGQPPPGQYLPSGAYPGASPASPMSQARFGRRASPGSDMGPGSGPLFPGQPMPMGYNAQGRQGSLAGAPPQDPAVAKAWALQQQQLVQQQRGMSRIPNGGPPNQAYMPSAHSTTPPRPAPIHGQQPAARQPMLNGMQAPYNAGQRPPMGPMPGQPGVTGPPPMQRSMGVPGQPAGAAPMYRGPQQGGVMPGGPAQRPPGSYGPPGAAPGQMARQPAAAMGGMPAGQPGSRPVPVPMGVLSGMPNGPGPRPMGMPPGQQAMGPAAAAHMARQPTLNGAQPGVAPNSMGTYGQQGGPRPTPQMPHLGGPSGAPMQQQQGAPYQSQSHAGVAAAGLPGQQHQQQARQQPRPISAASANRAAALAALSQRKAAAAQAAQQQKLQQQQQQQASQQQEQLRQQQLQQQQQRQQEQARQQQQQQQLQQQQQQQQQAQQKQRARQQLLQQQQQRRMQAQASQSRPPFSTSNDEEDEDGSWGAPPQHQAAPQRANDVSERPVGGSGSFASGAMVMEEDQGPVGPMVQCPSCSRSFNQQAYQKHAKVCAKVFASKRKVFNVAAARVAGTEAAKYFDPKKGQPKNSSAAPSGARRPGSALAAGKAAKAAKWKVQSEQLRAAMRCARGEAPGKGGADAGSSAPYQPPVDIDDRVPCPHCGRKFAELAAERHIPHCANTRAKPSFLNKQSGKGAYQVGKKR